MKKQGQIKRSKTIMQTQNSNLYNVNLDEMMTKNKLKKFKEIKRGQDVDLYDNSGEGGKGEGSRNSISGRSGKENINLYDELVDNVINYNVERSKWIFSPDDVWKILWDFVGMFFILYQGIVVPYRICFDVQAYGGIAVLELFQDFYFIVDIFITANTGYYEKGNLILLRNKILLNYLKLWLWLDIAASFPYPLIVNPADYFTIDNSSQKSQKSKAPQILRLLKFMRFMRFIRLLRVLKLKRILVRFEEIIMSDSFILIIQFLKLLFIVLFIAHWGACFWFYVGTSEFQNLGVSWISNSNLLDSSIEDQYISSIYFFITTMTTVGYGDIHAVTSNERIYTMFSMLITCGVFAYVIGSIGTVLSSRYDEEMIFKQKIMYVDQFLQKKSLSKGVRTKVRRYLEHVLENKREQKVDEAEVLSMLNKNLKEEVIMHLNGLLIRNIAFSAINKFDEFCILITNIMKEETLNPGDVIFQKGDFSLRLYFINNGIVTIYDQETKIIFNELNGSYKSETNKNANQTLTYFGEIGFFGGIKRTTSAEALSFVNLTYILLDLFKEMAYKFKNDCPAKFRDFEEDLNTLRKDIRKRNYEKIKVSCYLCNGENESSYSHISPQCPKMTNFNEYFKFKFKDRKHRTEQELKRIYDKYNGFGGFRKNSIKEFRRASDLSDQSKPSYSKNTNDVFFSFAEFDPDNNSLMISENEENGAETNFKTRTNFNKLKSYLSSEDDSSGIKKSQESIRSEDFSQSESKSVINQSHTISKEHSLSINSKKNNISFMNKEKSESLNKTNEIIKPDIENFPSNGKVDKSLAKILKTSKTLKINPSDKIQNTSDAKSQTKTNSIEPEIKEEELRKSQKNQIDLDTSSTFVRPKSQNNKINKNLDFEDKTDKDIEDIDDFSLHEEILKLAENNVEKLKKE